MRRRGRVVATVGVGGSQPWVHEDAPPEPVLDVDGFFVSVEDIAAAVAEVPAVDAPPTYVRLAVTPPIVVITRDLQVKRLAMDPGESVRLAYLPDGKFLVGEQGVDTFGGMHHTLDRERIVVVECRALPSPIGAARRDAAAVARWHVDPTGRTWEAGTPWPSPIPDDSPAVALSARAKRSISQKIRHSLDNLPAPFLKDIPSMVFNAQDGTFIAYNYTPEPADHYLVVPIGPGTDVDDVDPYLDRVRTTPSGRVLVPS
jgi:hypothetical protein